MLLEVADVNTFYGLSHVLRGVSLNLDRGEFVALLGRNGMGKSTTLKTIMGLVRPKSGSIIFNGVQTSGLAPFGKAQMGIGYVPEERRIFPYLTVRENLLIGAKAGKTDAGNSGCWTLEKVFDYFPTLRARATNKGAHLSGGEQQMLAIGRALMGNPSLLLVDEPTEGLAPKVVEVVCDVLARINEAGVSILLVEHNLSVAVSLGRRVYVMGKGHIGFSGTVDELEARADIRQQYLEV